MNTPQQIAKHLREVYSGRNWTVSNMKEHLADVTWEQATTHVYDLNTIAALVYHIGYYVSTALDALQDKPLNSKDEVSFAHPPINSQEDWEKFLAKEQDNAERLAQLIEQLPEEKLGENFTDAKYGIYYRNLHGIIEHAHYHLGQIVLIKKIINNRNSHSAL